MTTFKNFIGAAALLAVTGVAQAQFSSTVTAATEYEFRGVSLSANDPVLQGSLDYSFGNGFAIGAWASNIDYGPAYDGKTELDLYASYTGTISDKASWTAGAVFYDYPGSDALSATPQRPAAKLQIEPYPEFYVGGTFGPVSLKQWYSHDFGASSTGAFYTEANYTQALPANWTLSVHAGFSYGDYWDEDGPGGGDLFDYSIGLSYVWDRFTFGAKLTATDADGDREISNTYFANNARVVGWISTTLPWVK